MELHTLSASKLKTFSPCPKKYWYTYVEKQEKDRSIYAALGTCVHGAVDSYYKALRNNEQPPDPTIVYTDMWMQELQTFPEMQNDQKLYKEGWEMVNRYNFAKETPQDTEVEFRLPFPNEENPVCILHGYIDQLFEWGFKDLKTSKRKPSKFILDNDMQFIVYSWAFTVIQGYAPDRAIWHHLRTGEDVDAKVNLKKISLVADTITRLQRAKEYDSWDKCIGEACIFCSYQQLCLGDGEGE